MTRGELRDFLRLLGKRTDATDALINGFIENGETLIYAQARVSEMLGDPVTLSETEREDEGRYTLPADFVAPLAIFDSSGHEIRPAPLVALRGITSTSPVIRYSVYGFNIEFRGVPPADSEYDLIYYAQPALMTDDSDEPAMLVRYPQLFINAAMFWYRLWSEDPELASAHRQALDTDIEQVNLQAAGSIGALQTGNTGNLGNFNTGSAM